MPLDTGRTDNEDPRSCCCGAAAPVHKQPSVLSVSATAPELSLCLHDRHFMEHADRSTLSMRTEIRLPAAPGVKVPSLGAELLGS